MANLGTLTNNQQCLKMVPLSRHQAAANCHVKVVQEGWWCYNGYSSPIKRTNHNRGSICWWGSSMRTIAMVPPCTHKPVHKRPSFIIWHTIYPSITSHLQLTSIVLSSQIDSFNANDKFPLKKSGNIWKLSKYPPSIHLIKWNVCSVILFPLSCIKSQRERCPMGILTSLE